MLTVIATITTRPATVRAAVLPSAMNFSLFFIAEYASMVTASALMATLFFGGWDVPFTARDNIYSVQGGYAENIADFEQDLSIGLREVTRRLRLVGAHRGPAECLFAFGHGSTPCTVASGTYKYRSGIGSRGQAKSAPVDVAR